jgi:membrane-bound metal-dependent hydrolase YbcI (DUF457 family)
MAQAGIHGIVGLAIKKWLPNSAGLMLGIVLGNLLPDADNLAVAVATVAKLPTEGLHRTFTHSLFTCLLVMAVFWLVARITGKVYWQVLGLGLAAGILMHILLDLLIWFNGVAILWPVPFWLNLWEGVTPPDWFNQLMLPFELLFFGLYFVYLGSLARKNHTDTADQRVLSGQAIAQFVLGAIFLVPVFIPIKGFTTIFGLVYLVSLGIAIGVTIRMRKTLEFR